LQKWPRLAAVEATRRLALTGLDWEIVPAAPAPGQEPTADAKAAAAYCAETLARLEAFDDVLAHLARAIATGMAAAELVWDSGQLVDMVPVPASRLISDPHEPWRLRVLTEDEPSSGVALDGQPFKWLLHTPRSTPGRWFNGGLLRPSVLLYLAQSQTLRDWLVCAQTTGTPKRIAQVDPKTTETEKRQLLNMLDGIAFDGAAVLNKTIDLKFLEARGEGPFKDLQDYCNTEITILWLGQHLTTDIRNTGSRAAAEIHDRVREDLLVSDIASEGKTLRRDLLTPVVRARFGDRMPVPLFRRSLIQSVDTRVLAETLAIAVNDLGLPVSAPWVHRALGVPQPADGEATLSGRGK
jgi:phage gp29-like protein